MDMLVLSAMLDVQRQCKVYMFLIFAFCLHFCEINK